MALLQKKFQQKVRELLISKGWSQSALAREMDVAPMTVSQYLNGKRSPGLDVLERFAKALEVEPWELIDDSPVPEKVLSDN